MTTVEERVKERIHKYYWEDDINCATTTLKILAEVFAIELGNQVINAAIGMHGAGGFGAQCGLVEGTLMFLGIVGRESKLSDEKIVEACINFAGKFENRFGSLQCKILRPHGFKPDNPPHLCEEITQEAVSFSINYISSMLDTARVSPESNETHSQRIKK